MTSCTPNRFCSHLRSYHHLAHKVEKSWVTPSPQRYRLSGGTGRGPAAPTCYSCTSLGWTCQRSVRGVTMRLSRSPTAWFRARLLTFGKKRLLVTGKDKGLALRFACTRVETYAGRSTPPGKTITANHCPRASQYLEHDPLAARGKERHV